MCKEIAIFLNLSEPQLYTGHCFRRTSATLLVDAGGDILALKRHGGWKSSTVAEGYIDESVQSKISVSNKILSSIASSSTTTTSSIVDSDNVNINIHQSPNPGIGQPIVTFNNCTIQNVYLSKND